MTGLRAESLSFSHGDRVVLRGVDLVAPRGAVTALLGPNGSGKSTLLRLIAGVHRPALGRIELGGEDLSSMRRRDRARRIALVEQEWSTASGLCARDLVSVGRIPHQGWLTAGDGEADRIVEESLFRAGATEFAHREVTALSGGERQRVNIARALAQAPDLLLCDEPTNHLDARAQLDMLHLLRELASDGLTIVVALHDLNHAAAFADHLVVLNAGTVRVAGDAWTVLTPERILDVWRVEADVVPHPRSGRPLVVLAEGPGPHSARNPRHDMSLL